MSLQTRASRLRKLALPLEDIRKILQDEEPLSEALSQHLKTLQEKQQELSACIDVCNNLLQKAKSQGFAVALYHAEEFPAVTFIEGGVVGQKIQRVDALLLHPV